MNLIVTGLLRLARSRFARPLAMSAASAAFAVSATVLTACGSSSVVSSLVPGATAGGAGAPFIVFGDGLSDVGQAASGARYTVNDGGNVWVQTVAANYGLGISPQRTGGQGWALGNARISQKVAGTPSVTEQIDAFLAASKIGTSDVTIVSGGLTDIVALTTAYKAGSILAADVVSGAEQAGKDLAAQVRRLVAAGGTHVVVSGTYNVGKSPYAAALGETALLSQASTKFNTALLVNIVDQGANVLYIDAEYYLNLLINQPTSYSFTNSTAAACTGPAETCTSATLVPGTDYTKFVFADNKYPTPAAHAAFGLYAYNKMKARW